MSLLLGPGRMAKKKCSWALHETRETFVFSPCAFVLGLTVSLHNWGALNPRACGSIGGVAGSSCQMPVRIARFRRELTHGQSDHLVG
jgi:hypothetical protein